MILRPSGMEVYLDGSNKYVENGAEINRETGTEIKRERRQQQRQRR